MVDAPPIPKHVVIELRPVTTNNNSTRQVAETRQKLQMIFVTPKLPTIQRPFPLPTNGKQVGRITVHDSRRGKTHRRQERDAITDNPRNAAADGGTTFGGRYDSILRRHNRRCTIAIDENDRNTIRQQTPNRPTTSKGLHKKRAGRDHPCNELSKTTTRFTTGISHEYWIGDHACDCKHREPPTEPAPGRNRTPPLPRPRRKTRRFQK